MNQECEQIFSESLNIFTISKEKKGNQMQAHLIRFSVLTVILTMIVFPQKTNQVKVAVLGPKGETTSGLTCYYDDGVSCRVPTKNSDGSLMLTIPKGKTVKFFVSDNSRNPVFSSGIFEVSGSKKSHELHIPYFPKNDREASVLLESILNYMIATYNTLDMANLIYELATKKSVLMTSLPGIFEFQPAFVDGKIMFELKGSLVDSILDVFPFIQGSFYSFKKYNGQI